MESLHITRLSSVLNSCKSANQPALLAYYLSKQTDAFLLSPEHDALNRLRTFMFSYLSLCISSALAWLCKLHLLQTANVHIN